MNDFKNSTLIVPAILEYSIEDYVKRAKEFSFFCKVIHLDIMDGIYVETKSPDLRDILNQLEKHSIKEISYNIHLMVSDPKEMIDIIASYNFHERINIKLVYLPLTQIDSTIFEREDEINLAVSIRPETDINQYKEILLRFKDIQIMTVIPGNQGCKFNPNALEKINILRSWGFKGKIHIDGSINKETLPIIANYLPDVLNVGSAISKSSNPENTYKELVSIINQ